MDVSWLAAGFEEHTMLLLRTDFGDDPAWSRVVEHVLAPADFHDEPENLDEGDDGLYEPRIQAVDDRRLEGATADGLAAAWDREDESARGYVLLADAASMAESGEGPSLTVAVVDLCVDREDEEKFGDVFGRSFRCVASEVASVEVNLDISNVDFSELADAADEDGGVLRRSSD